MRRNCLNPFFTVAIALAFVAIAIVTLRISAGPIQNSNKTTFTLPPTQQFTNTGRQLVSISPDGTLVVYVANTQLHLYRLSDKTSRAVAGTLATQGGVTNPVFSPDGKSIAYFATADQSFKRIPVEGGTPVTLFRGPNPLGMSWSSDGRLFVGAATTGILVGSVDGGAADTIIKMLPGEGGAQGPQLLPDGDSLMFTLAENPNAWDSAKIVVQSLKSGTRKTILEGGHDARYLPNGRIVYARGASLVAATYDIQRQTISGTPIVVQEKVESAGNGSSHFSLSASGALVFISGTSELELSSVALDGTAKLLTRVPVSIFAPRLSPDDKQVAYDAADGIWICDLATGAKRQLLGPGNRYPLWSLDGTRIFYIADGSNTQSLWTRKADGTDKPEQLVDPARAPESWSAANQLLSFITLKTGQGADYDIWAYSLRDKKAQPLIEIPGTVQHSSRFSPDSKWIAYVSNESGEFEVYVQPYPATGQKFKISNNGGYHPMWSPDGSKLYFDSNDHMFVSAIQTRPEFKVGPAVAMPIVGFQGGGANSRRRYDMTADGKQFVMLFVKNQIEIVPRVPLP